MSLGVGWAEEDKKKKEKYPPKKGSKWKKKSGSVKLKVNLADVFSPLLICLVAPKLW